MSHYFQKNIRKNKLLTSTRSSNTDGGGTSTNELGGSINISVLDGDREWAKISFQE